MSHTDRQPVLVVDAANVVGSVPDGWWRDRLGATIRLRDRLASLAHNGIAGVAAPVRVILVTEGKARGVASVADVEVVEAPGSGDDAIVALVADILGHTARSTGQSSDATRSVILVTADRELRSRVTDLGAEIVGPSAIPR